ncbi:MAG: hypothetical protein K9L21_03145 [Spirochaetia bacterium]|nr:hypothetical protein [Spirochaetia bacterium]
MDTGIFRKSIPPIPQRASRDQFSHIIHHSAVDRKKTMVYCRERKNCPELFITARVITAREW